MANSLFRKQIGQGIYFSAVSDKKFKYNRITVNFIVPLSKDIVTNYALIPFLLRKGCRTCPDFSALNAKLSSLYGASLEADVIKYGKYQILEVSILGIDDRFTLQNEHMVEECANLLCQIVLDANLPFPEKDTALEKQYLIDTISAEINDKRSYALQRCRSIMFENSPVALRKYGEIEQAKAITAKTATEAYCRLKDTAAVEIVFTGSGDFSLAQNILQKTFGTLNRTPYQIEETQKKQPGNQPREYTDYLDVKQSKLVMGFTTGYQEKKEIAVYKLLSCIYGGSPFSRLFLNVRERLSLCYYCAARFDAATGTLTVDSGIEKENKEKAMKEILNQLEIIKKGEFDQTEIENAKLILKNSYETVTDSLNTTESWYLTQILEGTLLSPQEMNELIQNVTKQQLMAAAAKIKLDTVYFLTGKEA